MVAESKVLGSDNASEVGNSENAKIDRRNISKFTGGIRLN